MSAFGSVGVVKDAARGAVGRVRDAVLSVSHSMCECPETAFEEYATARTIGDCLRGHGFDVEQGVAGLPTALVATAGSGDLVIGICAEMDALPGIGHACGHNVIAAAGVAAGIALASVADRIGVTVKVFGTPAEEFGGGKIIMLDHGVFDGVHAAMMVHPGVHEWNTHYARAVIDLEVAYTGRTAHAAAAPYEGVNAADAVTVAQVAIGLMRQQLRPGELVHGIVTGGGEAPNVIPGSASMVYDARAATLAQLDGVRARLRKCFEAGAVATWATMTVTEKSLPFAEFRNDDDMARLYRVNAEKLGRVFEDTPGPERQALAGSTDMGNVSLVIPAIHPTIRIDAHGASNHQPEFARWCAQPDADKAIIDAGIAMAWTATDLATDANQRTRLLDGHSVQPP